MKLTVEVSNFARMRTGILVDAKGEHLEHPYFICHDWCKRLGLSRGTWSVTITKRKLKRKTKP